MKRVKDVSAEPEAGVPVGTISIGNRFRHAGKEHVRITPPKGRNPELVYSFTGIMWTIAPNILVAPID